MYCRFERTLAVIALAACLSPLSCNRQPATTRADRIAILRFENLGIDTSTDWMGRAFSEILTAELTASSDADPISSTRMHALNQTFGARPISAPGISAERTLAMASGAAKIGYGDYAVRGGRLEAQLTIEDARTGKTLQVLASSAAAGDVTVAASSLAHQVSPQVREFDTRNSAALKAWVVALESKDAAAVGPSLESAIAADPDFAPPYRLLAQWKAQRQDRAGALSLLDQALARGDRISPIERASIDLEAATLREDPVRRMSALQTLVKLEPRDAGAWRSLADAALAGRDYKLAIQAYQKSAEWEPENIVTWNQLGYAMAYSGDLNGALGALRRYQALRPGSSDPIDSQGDVQLVLGHLREAEELYLQAARATPGFPNAPDLFKAAMARLMTGDISAADHLAGQYVAARRAAHDLLVDYFEAEWQWVAGRRKQGYRQLEAFAQAAPSKEIASNAYAELTMWGLFLGDHAGAEQMARKAMPPSVATPAPLALLARFLVQPPATPSEWTVRAGRIFPNPDARDTAVAYALVLNQQFPQAAPILKQIYDRSSAASDDTARTLLAWSWIEAGRVEDAAPLLRLNPIPQLTGTGPLVSFYFPRIFYLRALAAQKDGKADEARANYRLFLQLSGPDPLSWGEEKKAQAAVGSAP